MQTKAKESGLFMNFQKAQYSKSLNNHDYIIIYSSGSIDQ